MLPAGADSRSVQRLLKVERIALVVAALVLALLVAATLLNRRAREDATLYGLFEPDTLLLAAILLTTAAATFGAGRWLGRKTSGHPEDPLTSLGNRGRLVADLARTDLPSSLLLFDLDGFKRYNDTFGHPAGDALLVRLGKRLAATVEGRGRAYRLDGDEFGVLAPASANLDELAADATVALSETGDGFAVGCSYGAARLPVEARDATEALRLADRRLYAAKQGSSRSAGRQSSDVLLQAFSERYPATNPHGYSVAEVASAVADRLGVPAEEAIHIGQAGELHDVGKIAIPDAILEKPGALDADEWEYVRQHPLVGERIVAAAPALSEAARLVRSTHERWDGSGYPDGLAGEDIPLGSRIIAICDAYNAMMGARSYRPGIGEEMAFEQLRRCAGSQFDPELVRVFFAVHAELRAHEPAELAV